MTTTQSTIEATTAAIELRGLKKSFDGTRVLDGFDLKVARGETVALIGPSGAGKTTALRCLNLLELPDDGALLLHDDDVAWKRMDERALARHRSRVGMVFQDFNLFGHLRVLANIMEAPVRVLGQSKAQATTRAHALLDAVGLPEKSSSFPSELSGGQQQRVAIARALAMSPDVLLLDEVTSALDVENVAILVRVLREVAAKGTTLVMVTHDLSFAADVTDRLCFVADGRVLEHGPPSTLLKEPKSERLREFLRTS